MPTKQLSGLFTEVEKPTEMTSAIVHPYLLHRYFALIPDIVVKAGGYSRTVVFTPTSHRGALLITNLMVRFYNDERTRNSDIRLAIALVNGKVEYSVTIHGYITISQLKDIYCVLDEFLVSVDGQKRSLERNFSFYVVTPLYGSNYVYITTDKRLAYEARKGSVSNMYTEDGKLCAVGAIFCEKVSSEVDCEITGIKDTDNFAFKELEINLYKEKGYKVYLSQF